ncbi:monovalent cation/H(+) antiporter subunit G [Parasulfitobacter algicola]|uniref:Monovalent cation/H(+) antiporter subunit G n=1 Tax=Parasulfitobacter algicola TaxID=2614809 RepID=A0ABX2IKA1_9RHOB|nr:monovalent cation/H(+) antiporter subunit G [Sulfitobacter algicola]NSX53312.1 monovalent cation/H(+) antiporter subunit G [Sulfitobacter algicola]
MIEVLIGCLALVGAFFAFIAALGILRLPDVLVRMHASTKAGTLACGLIMAGAALFFADATVTFRVIAIVLFLLLTAPVAAHMIGRAAVRTGVKLRNIHNQPD